MNKKESELEKLIDRLRKHAPPTESVTDLEAEVRVLRWEVEERDEKFRVAFNDQRIAAEITVALRSYYVYGILTGLHMCKLLTMDQYCKCVDELFAFADPGWNARK